MKVGISFLLTLFLFCVGSPSFAQDFYIYPAEGQSDEQRDKDKYECYNWARKESGFDPMKVPQASAPPPEKEEQEGGAGEGFAKGLIGGAAIGAIAGDTGKGAAIGAIGGGLIGGSRRSEQQKREQQKQQQWEQQQAQQYAQARNSYNRAYVACLEARGYSVK
ncbi:MAG: glycine zipper domain-containing protein [Gammaproteobacteria bacterium]|nr:glycine zipper domain-containing protein [Gammaproteobacteria bacterium]